MFIGHGSKNQIKNFGKVKKIIDEIVKDIPLKSKLLYFGDEPNPKAPDIGLVYEYINEQINECKGSSNWTFFDFQMLNSLKASIDQFKDEYKIVYGKGKK